MARIVLGDVLAEHGVELRGRARVSGRGSFGSGRTAGGWVCHRGRTDITLARSPKSPWPCRLPGPVTRYAVRNRAGGRRAPVHAGKLPYLLISSLSAPYLSPPLLHTLTLQHGYQAPLLEVHHESNCAARGAHGPGGSVRGGDARNVSVLRPRFTSAGRP